MGVFPYLNPVRLIWGCLPHARGGVSRCGCGSEALAWSSPRPWGCFYWADADKRFVKVFPTPVGVFPRKLLAVVSIASLPHARGGVSESTLILSHHRASSPRPWGCFPHRHRGRLHCLVFPTPVGVFLPKTAPQPPKTRLPHARGGVSVFGVVPARLAVSSPRPWGCFRSGRKGCGG